VTVLAVLNAQLCMPQHFTECAPFGAIYLSFLSLPDRPMCLNYPGSASASWPLLLLFSVSCSADSHSRRSPFLLGRSVNLDVVHDDVKALVFVVCVFTSSSSFASIPTCYVRLMEDTVSMPLHRTVFAVVCCDNELPSAVFSSPRVLIVRMIVVVGARAARSGVSWRATSSTAKAG
jgi:hypothetical protein